MPLFCFRCGASSPDLARYCGSCGGALEEPPPSVEPSVPGTTPILCVRCSESIGEAARCPRCGAQQPLPSYSADPYWSDALSFFPTLLRSPLLTADTLRYRGDLRGLILPALLVTCGAALAWILFNLTALLPQSPLEDSPLPAAIQWLALVPILLATPWYFLAYAALVQWRARLAGGSGTLERTVRLLGMLWGPTLLLMGGWGALYQLSKRGIPWLEFWLNNPTLRTGPWWPVYEVLPLIALVCLGACPLIALSYQMAITARANWMDIGRMVLIHLPELGLFTWWLIGVIERAPTWQSLLLA